MSPALKPGYKQTEAGVVPEDWEIVSLGSVGHWFSGGTPSMANDLFWNGEIPWVSAKDMKVARLRDSILHVSEKAIGNGTRIAPLGAVLIVVRGMILAHTLPVAIATRPVAFNQDMKALVVRAGIAGEFILLWLQTNAQQVLGITSESTHGTKRIPSEDLFSMKVALPRLAEQEAIAEALSDADALTESLEQLLAKKSHLKQGAMQALLTGKKRLPGFEIKQGYTQTEVGVIPEDWRIETVEVISDVGRGRVISHREIGRSRSPKYPVYSSQTSENGVMGYIDTFDFDGEYVTWTTDGANAGTVFHRSGKFNCTNVCGTIKLKSDDHFFVAKVLGTIAPRHVSRHLGNPKLMNDVMKRIKIPLPPTKAEQTAIAAILSGMDAEIAALEAKLAKARQIKQGMMQELLTGRTRLV